MLWASDEAVIGDAAWYLLLTYHQKRPVWLSCCYVCALHIDAAHTSAAAPDIQLHAMQDAVLCIYSVDYPLKQRLLSRILTAATRWLMRLGHSLLPTRASASLMRPRVPITAPDLQASDGQQAISEGARDNVRSDAWGRVSLGMRLARLSRRQLLADVQCVSSGA